MAKLDVNALFQNLRCGLCPQVSPKWNCASRPLRGWY